MFILYASYEPLSIPVNCHNGSEFVSHLLFFLSNRFVHYFHKILNVLNENKKKKERKEREEKNGRLWLPLSQPGDNK